MIRRIVRRRAPRRRGRVPVLTGALLLAVGVSAASVVGAQPLPSCGGQNAAPQPVPYTCTTQTKLIDGSHVYAIVVADGHTVTVTYHLLAPRSSDAAIRITHHIGISGAGGPEAEAQGVIPAGHTTATLVVTSPCMAGQVDIKFVFLVPATGRVGGPWITNGTGCTPATTTTTTTTVPSTSTTTTSTLTTAPPTSSATTAATTVPSSVSPSIVATTLPITGATTRRTLNLALVAVLAGAALIVIAARRRSQQPE